MTAPANKPISQRPPLYVWIAWSFVILDLVGFVAVVAGYQWGYAHGEGVLGCFGLTAIAFLPLLASAGLLTYLWRRGLWRQAQSGLTMRAAARQIRKDRQAP